MKKHSIRWLLCFYDLLLYLLVVTVFILVSLNHINYLDGIIIASIYLVALFAYRFIFKVYKQIWRYGGTTCYIRLLLADALAFGTGYLIQRFLPLGTHFGLIESLAVTCSVFIVSLFARLAYRYAFLRLRKDTKFSRRLFKLINFFGRTDISIDEVEGVTKSNIAIISAARVGTSLAKELISNPRSNYNPKVFISNDKEKIGRKIEDIDVISLDKATPEVLNDLKIQEIVFANNSWDVELKKEVYERYSKAGFKIKTYDFPVMENANPNAKRYLREFDIEELLFRKQIDVINDETKSFYENKVVLVTGGGGSIGSELCRQLAKMNPKQIIILDIYENCAYDVQQELKMKYGTSLNLQVEIISICNYAAMERVFAKYNPNIVVMAAAHKHVPLMEHNVVEAVENNVFGTLNTVLLAEKYNVDRVHMVSTDKAVNPTSVMGATKRICEMIVQSHSTKNQHTTFSATRFGNVLGSAGSVIPLFKRQIANGGPVTLTDYRIIRYFMTIPEASQLVLQSASMAKNGELFVLDMGQPVKIYDLAVNMIKLSGYEVDKDIKIIETGLRPGEKLYEELLVKTEELDKTDNELIFIERDKPLSLEDVDNMLVKLKDGISVGDDANMKNIIKDVVPTFIEKEEANKDFKGEE